VIAPLRKYWPKRRRLKPRAVGPRSTQKRLVRESTLRHSEELPILLATLCDEERGAPLEHVRPLDLESHVHNAVVTGRDVEHRHRRIADERKI
jgi:hypothetical protein